MASVLCEEEEKTRRVVPHHFAIAAPLTVAGTTTPGASNWLKMRCGDSPLAVSLPGGPGRCCQAATWSFAQARRIFTMPPARDAVGSPRLGVGRAAARRRNAFRLNRRRELELLGNSAAERAPLSGLVTPIRSDSHATQGNDDVNIQLQDLIAQAQIPGLPQSAIRLLELSQDPSCGPAEFAAPIEADPGLTGQVLKFVNSSYFGFSRDVTSVKLAITLVGARTIKNFVLWTAVFSLMPNPKCGNFDLKRLRQDSLRRGLFARTLANFQSVRDVEEPFAAALLQDVAVPVLAQHLPSEYEEMFEQRFAGARLSDLERERFGWSHAEAGEQITRGWNLPESFSSLIGSHCNVELVGRNSSNNPGAAAVALSSLLPSAIDEQWSEVGALTESYAQLPIETGASLLEALEQVDRDYVEFAPLLKLTNPGRSLAETYAEAAGVAQEAAES